MWRTLFLFWGQFGCSSFLYRVNQRVGWKGSCVFSVSHQNALWWPKNVECIKHFSGFLETMVNYCHQMSISRKVWICHIGCMQYTFGLPPFAVSRNVFASPAYSCTYTVCAYLKSTKYKLNGDLLNNTLLNSANSGQKCHWVFGGVFGVFFFNSLSCVMALWPVTVCLVFSFYRLL